MSSGESGVRSLFMSGLKDECFTCISTAVEVGVPKLGNCLEMYTCTQARAQFVHSMCTSLDTPCTLVHCLATPCTPKVYTCLGTGLGTCVHFQAVSKLEHSNFYSSAQTVRVARV